MSSHAITDGVAKHKNRHLLDVERALLYDMHTPKCFWSDTLLTAGYLINEIPSTILDGASPHLILFTSSLAFHLPPKVFARVCYVLNLGPSFDKFDL